MSKVQGVVIPGVTRMLVFSYLQPILGFPVIGQAIAHVRQRSLIWQTISHSSNLVGTAPRSLLTRFICRACLNGWDIHDTRDAGIKRSDRSLVQ